MAMIRKSHGFSSDINVEKGNVKREYMSVGKRSVENISTNS